MLYCPSERSMQMCISTNRKLLTLCDTQTKGGLEDLFHSSTLNMMNCHKISFEINEDISQSCSSCFLLEYYNYSLLICSHGAVIRQRTRLRPTVRHSPQHPLRLIYETSNSWLFVFIIFRRKNHCANSFGQFPFHFSVFFLSAQKETQTKSETEH